MDGEKSIGYGIVIWLILFAVNSVFFALKLHDFFLINVLMAGFAGVLAFKFSIKKITPTFFTTSIWLGVIWAAVGIVMDAVVSRHFYPEILRSWGLWVGYILVIAAPILHQQKDIKAKKRANPRYHP